jgi:sporulation protein YlmC with PRC-barrel domain
MAAQLIRVVPTDDDASVAPGMYMHLSDMKGFTIQHPVPDIRGWKVVLPDGRRMGKVEDLIVDTDDLTIKYLEVKVDHDVLGAEDDTWVLVPLSAVQLRDDGELVVIDRVPLGGLAGAPRQDRGTVPTPAEERVVHRYYGTDGPEAPVEAVVMEAVIVDGVAVAPLPDVSQAQR